MVKISSDECFAARRKIYALSVEAKLSLPGTGDPALKRSVFDRFVFTYVDSKSKGIKGNLSLSDYYEFFRMSGKALDDFDEFRTTPKCSGSTLGPIATDPITIGTFKGKTVLEALKGGQKEELLKTCAWFESNISKFPNNKKFVDLIKEGVKLYDEGKLKDVTATSVTGKVYTIYDTKVRYFKNETDEKGRTKCYQLRFEFDANKNYPFAVYITNYYAFIGEDNLIKKVDKTEDVTRSISLSSAEMDCLRGEMKRTLQLFDMAHAPKLIERVEGERFTPSKK